MEEYESKWVTGRGFWQDNTTLVLTKHKQRTKSLQYQYSPITP